MGGGFVEVAIALVFDGAGRLLVCRRKPGAVLGDYWEFPGGKCDAGEAAEGCARREVREEVGIEVEVLGKLAVIEHVYAHAAVRLRPFLCRHVSGEVRLLAVAEARWIEAGEVREFRFPEANGRLVEEAARGFAHLRGLAEEICGE